MRNKLFFNGFLMCFMLNISSCQTEHAAHPTAGDEIKKTMLSSIENDRSLYARSQFSKRRANFSNLNRLKHYLKPVSEKVDHFDVSANGVPAADFFASLVDGTNVNMIIHPNVKGSITLHLKQVRIEQVLEAARDMYGFDYRKNSYGYEILPATLATKLFHVNYINFQRQGTSSTIVNSGQISNKVGTSSTGSSTSNSSSTTNNNSGNNSDATSKVLTKSDVTFWKDLESSIKLMLNTDAGQSVSTNPQAGIVMVKAFPIELKTISHYLQSMQNNLDRQVIIEAKILEIQLSDDYNAGINWGLVGGNAAENDGDTGLGQNANQAFANTDITTFSQMFALRIKGHSFSSLIKMLQVQGNVQVLSSPHISTINNQKAVIKVGQDNFFVTGISSTSSVSNGGVTSTPTQDVSLTPFFSGITLDVTPEINGQDEIVMHIHPSVSKVTEELKTIQVGNTSNGTNNILKLPLASSTIRESDSVVRAKDNQVIVIAGLMENSMREAIAATPKMGQIPFLGAIFRNTQQKSQKTELVILLQPKIVKSHVWVTELESHEKVFEKNLRPFHQGGLTRIFGNEAEKNKNF